MIGLFIFIVIFPISFMSVSIYRRWGVKNNLLAVPNERSSHTEPTPHGAGIVIVAICLATFIPISIFITGTFSWGYFTGAFLIALISFIDDFYPLRFHWRLLVHSVPAILLIADLETWHGITMLGGLRFGILGSIVSFVWFFLFDSVVTIVRRGLRGEKIWLPHREHLFQKLVSAGFSHRHVTVIYGILASLLSISVLASVQFRDDIGLAMFPVVSVLTIILLFIVFRRRLHRPADPANSLS